jgi:hypothetical protein
VKLELSTGKVLEDLSAETIAHALATLPAGDDSWAVLQKDEMHYMQTGGPAQGERTWGDGFVLEYQEGSLDSHYRCVQEDLELSAIQRAFQLYFEDDDRWRTEYEWQLLDLSSLKKRWWQFWR